MLVLSRQRDETIMIGDLVEITVVDIRGDKVRLGINAPPQVAVHRKEIYEAIKAENRQAAAANGEDIGQLNAVRPGKRQPVPAAGRIADPRPSQARNATAQPDRATHAAQPRHPAR